ncbi:MAG: SDR family oxidoreductase [Candidatus Omnitrophica bacterium]|nr:SDR family oxidoreductase [Candidatus Omnitrophota bacterium]
MLSGKVILITGSSRGIGSETARLAAGRGASVVINYNKDRSGAESTAAAIKKAGKGRAVVVKADVSREDEAGKLIDLIVKKFGKIDVLINNASAPIEYTPLSDIKWKSFQKHYEVTLRGALNMVKRVVPFMSARGRGKIINILSSVTVGVPPSKFADYISAKYALLGFSRALAVELGSSGITVNCISPGMTNTAMTEKLPAKMKEIVSYTTPLKRLAEPVDIARVAAFLCSSDSDYITGVNIPVCGGSVM